MAKETEFEWLQSRYTFYKALLLFHFILFSLIVLNLRCRVIESPN